MSEQKTPHVYQAISAVMGELAKVGIGKNNKNAAQGYKFRGIDDVYNALAPLLSRSQLLILPRVLNRTVSERETKNGGVLFYVVVDVEFDLVSGVDGSKHTIRVIGEAMDSGDKATNKAMSAAYKYACMEAFCIPTEGDNDADATTHEVTSRPGVTVVDPRGENRPPKNQPLVDTWVKRVEEAIKSWDDKMLPAAIYAIHSELVPDAHLYIDVGDELADKGILGKGRWKELVREGNPKRKAA
jgi:hypothetical protein